MLYLASLFLLMHCADRARVGSVEQQVEHEEVYDAVTLGKELFFDKILSADRSISCASCHKPEFAYADNKKFSLGVKDSLGIRNTPSVMNLADRPYFFYDGRVPTLEAQVRVPIENPIEMHLKIEDAVRRVQKEKKYQRHFLHIYDTIPTVENVAHALAEFQRSLVSDGSAPHDMWMSEEDTTLVSASAHRGRELFISDEMKCFECHFGPDFTGDEFRNIGLYDGVTLLDVGRYEVTKDSSDLGKFKTPGLRNVALTAPYMHNGMLETLEEVIDFYSNPYDFVKHPINMDTLMLEPLNLTPQQKTDLVNFLHSLTDKDIPHRDIPID